MPVLIQTAKRAMNANSALLNRESTRINANCPSDTFFSRKTEGHRGPAESAAFGQRRSNQPTAVPATFPGHSPISVDPVHSRLVYLPPDLGFTRAFTPIPATSTSYIS